MNHAQGSANPSDEQLLRTVFWTLWVIVVVFTSYGFAAEFFGLSIFGNGDMPRYHMGVEAEIVSGVACYATLMLGVTSCCIRCFSRALFRLGLLACAFLLFYIYVPPRF